MTQQRSQPKRDHPHRSDAARSAASAEKIAPHASDHHAVGGASVHMPGRQPHRGVRTGTASRLQLALITLLGACNLCWLFLIVKETDPDSALNRVWFVVALMLSSVPIASLVVYAARLPRATGLAVRHCLSDSLREGFLIGSLISANAVLRMTTFWSIWTAILLFAVAGMADLIVLSRRWAPPVERS